MARFSARALFWLCVMTTAAYLSDRRDQKTWTQLSRQAAEEEAWRREPFKPARINLLRLQLPQHSIAGGAPVMYTKFCANVMAQGEGARQGTLSFPPLLDVSSKPRRTVDDIVGLLKDPHSLRSRTTDDIVLRQTDRRADERDC